MLFLWDEDLVEGKEEGKGRDVAKEARDAIS